MPFSRRVLWHHALRCQVRRPKPGLLSCSLGCCDEMACAFHHLQPSLPRLPNGPSSSRAQPPSQLVFLAPLKICFCDPPKKPILRTAFFYLLAAGFSGVRILMKMRIPGQNSEWCAGRGCSKKRFWEVPVFFVLGGPIANRSRQKGRCQFRAWAKRLARTRFSSPFFWRASTLPWSWAGTCPEHDGHFQQKRFACGLP